MDYINEEKILSQRLQILLSNEFDIITEDEIIKRPGKFLLDGKGHKSIPDLIIRPKKNLISSDNFIETIIPIEIKKFGELNVNKFEDLMIQCHSYRFSLFENQYPKLCLYFIDNFFETNQENIHLIYNYNASKIPGTNDRYIRKCLYDKNMIETLFGRFGIGELLIDQIGYKFRLKRQLLFEKSENKIIFKPNVLNFWWGTRSNSKKIS